MKGKHRIIVQNKKIKYDFELKRNITVIRGDSATGKTALVDMIREYYENGEDSGIDLRCDKTCTVLEGRNWKNQLALYTDCIVFIDEGNPFVASTEFASAIQKTDNYYVVVTRESISALAYSVEEIYGIRNSGKYGRLKQTYNEMYHIYNVETIVNDIKPEIVVAEHSNSGFQFLTDICEKNNLMCESANGKSNIYKVFEKHKEKAVLIVADGAAFGPEMEKVMKMTAVYGNVTLYLPESFEWLILKSGIVKDNEIEQILEEPSKYIDSKVYLSWERFFTQLLINKTKHTYLAYNKHKLNPAYVQVNIEKKIMEVMKKINLLWKN